VQGGVVTWLPQDSAPYARAARMLNELRSFADEFEAGITAHPSVPGGIPGLTES
jgi:hypothetical protein